MIKEFDFNCHSLESGAKIISSAGRVVYEVIKTAIPSWETPDPRYKNDGLWIQVKDNEGQIWSQPVQWFNAVIGANEGMTVQGASK